MYYCTGGYKRIIINSIGGVQRCYSRPATYNIFNFNFKRDIKIQQCDAKNCGVCDQGNNIISKDINDVILKSKSCDDPDCAKNTKIIQISSTSKCIHFCPYCKHSDNTVNRKIHETKMTDYVKFTNQFPINIHTSIQMLGGEPFLRNDISEILNTKIHTVIFFTSGLHSKGVKEVINKAQKVSNKAIIFVATIHPHARDFNWDIFWNNMRMLQQSQYVELHKIQLINYKIEHIKDKIIRQCQKLNIPFDLKSLDTTIVPERIGQEQIKDFNNCLISSFYHL